MDERKFCVGDRVVVVVDEVMDGNTSLIPGVTGTVRCFDYKNNPGVEWDIVIDSGHELDGKCEYGYGWYVRPTDIELFIINPEFEVDCDEVLSICGGLT